MLSQLGWSQLKGERIFLDLIQDWDEEKQLPEPIRLTRMGQREHRKLELAHLLRFSLKEPSQSSRL